MEPTGPTRPPHSERRQRASHRPARNGMAETAIITRVLDSVQQLDAQAWNALLASQAAPTPFMRHEYLSALESSGSAVPQTGWAGRVVTLWQGGELVPPRPAYAQAHRSEEHTTEIQSHLNLVCRLLLQKKNMNGSPRLM